MSLRRRKVFNNKMQSDRLVEASKLLVWTRRLLAPIGIWPKNTNNLCFAISFTYVFLHVTMKFGHLMQHIDNFETIVNNLSESTPFTILLVKMAVFRKNHILSQMIDAMIEDCANEKYRILKEQKIYAMYNSMAKTFYKILLPLGYGAAFIYYLKPLAEYIFTPSHNGTISFVLPYQTRLFYEITNVYTYALTYAYQAGSAHLVSCGTVGTDGLLVSLTLHVCGQLAVLADSIINLSKDTRNGHYLSMGSILERHLRLIWMARKIDTAFRIIFLCQLVGTALVICLNGFNLVLNSERTQKTSIIAFAFYEAVTLSLLYSYCFIGECLIRESERFHDAFYQSAWYEMQPSQSKYFIICMARSQKTLHLTAGKLYIFSLENFAAVIKASMTYLSVLRNMTYVYFKIISKMIQAVEFPE